MLKGVAPTEMQLVTVSAKARPNSAWQTIDISPFCLLYREIILHTATQYDYKNAMINPKIHYKSKIQYNYSNDNCIAELFTVNSCWNGVNIWLATKCVN